MLHLHAIAGVAASCCSTNALLHLLALAQPIDLPLSIDDFDRVSRRTPQWADLKPSGRYTAVDLNKAGGTGVIAGRLLAAGLIDGSTLTPTGPLAAVVETPAQTVVAPLGRTLKAHGGLAILNGNLAPEGCVEKVSSHERLLHRGPARVFECEKTAMAAVTRREIQPNDVVLIRNEGPLRDGPGMREMLGVTAALVGAGLGEQVALLTDSRFSGATRGPWRDTRLRKPLSADPLRRCRTETPCPSMSARVASSLTSRTAHCGRAQMDTSETSLHPRRHGEVCRGGHIGGRGRYSAPAQCGVRGLNLAR